MAVVIALHLGNLAAVFRVVLPPKPRCCLRHVTTVDLAGEIVACC
jgi:hypothetical protein